MRDRTAWQRNIARVMMMSVLFLALVGGLTSSQPSNAQTHLQAAVRGAIDNSAYAPVENISCNHLEGMVMHLHAHVSLYLNGHKTSLPQYVGIARNERTGHVICYYWLHIHDTLGIIHIEPPVHQTFTFGQFLHEWHQRFWRLGFPNQLLLTNGWTIWTNGQPYSGTLESIPLTEHALITVAYNSPKAKPDTLYAWPY